MSEWRNARMSNSPGESNLFLVRRLAPRGRLQFQDVAWRATIRVALAGARKCPVPGTAPQLERKRTHRVRCQGFVARKFRISLLVDSMSLRETDSLAGKARMRVHRCSVTGNWPRRTPKEAPVANGCACCSAHVCRRPGAFWSDVAQIREAGHQ